MTLVDLLTDMTLNFGFALPDFVLIVTIIISLIFFATNLKLGLTLLMILFSTEFVLFSLLGYDATHFVFAILITLIFMAFSLLTSTEGSRVV